MRVLLPLLTEMNLKNLAAASLIVVLLVPSLASVACAQGTASPVAPEASEAKAKVAIARVWHGRTPAAKADEYYAYLNEAGIRKIQAIADNLGVQVFRRTTADVTEFTVISYWASRDAIKQFAGADIEKTHNLPRDAEYLLELEPTVKHHEVVLNDWKR